ncbi:hypothetical protein HN51_051590 [Arachis hypogaea]
MTLRDDEPLLRRRHSDEELLRRHSVKNVAALAMPPPTIPLQVSKIEEVVPPILTKLGKILSLFFFKMSTFGSANTNPNKSYEVTQPPGDSISSLCFSSKANFLVTTSWDNQVLCSTWKDDGTTVFSGGCDKQGVKVLYRTKELEEQQAKSRIWNETWLDAGMEWILHLDTDELMHPAGAREYSLRQLLHEVLGNVDVVSSVERDDIKEPFSEA